MRRTIVKSARMGEEYLRLEHESGLVILFYPMKGFRTAYAIFGTKYGSVDSEFKTPEDEDFVKVPDGVAHYLEHKLFESEEGSVDRLFAGAGAEANAFTGVLPESSAGSSSVFPALIPPQEPVPPQPDQSFPPRRPPYWKGYKTSGSSDTKAPA